MYNSSNNREQTINWKNLFSKKWLFPSLYLGVVGTLFGISIYYAAADNFGEETEVAMTTTQTMCLPISEDSQAEPCMEFYANDSAEEKRVSAIVKYDNNYFAHGGVDFARKDGKSFGVVAALDGKVLKVEENPLVGKQIKLEHEGGLVTVYQGVDYAKVKPGDTVSRGDTIAKSGLNKFEKNAGNHLHFEVVMDSQRVDPQQYLKCDK